MSAHDSSINQYGSNTGAEEIQKVQKEIQKSAQMQKDVEELATIMNLASPQKPHLFSKNRSTASCRFFSCSRFCTTANNARKYSCKY
jgi:hypothetical protein